MTDHVPATPEQRAAAVDHLCELGELELLDVAGLEAATARALAATTQTELAQLLHAMPGAIRWTPEHAVLDERREVDVRGGVMALGQGWQLASTTEVRVAGGHLVLDLGSVSFDDVVTDLFIETRGGNAEIIVPSAVHVVLGDVERKGGVLDDRLGTSVALPGMPTVRISMRSAGGTVRFRRPSSPTTARSAGWFRRRFGRRP